MHGCGNFFPVALTASQITLYDLNINNIVLIWVLLLKNICMLCCYWNKSACWLKISTHVKLRGRTLITLLGQKTSLVKYDQWRAYRRDRDELTTTVTWSHGNPLWTRLASTSITTNLPYLRSQTRHKPLNYDTRRRCFTVTIQPYLSRMTHRMTHVILTQNKRIVGTFRWMAVES